MTKRFLVALFFLAFAVVAGGCGGLPKPVIKQVPAAKGTTNIRIAMVATNFDENWKKENLRLRIKQQWLDRDDVPVETKTIAEKSFFDPQGTERAGVELRDAEGDSSRDVVLAFELESGPDPLNQNISAATVREWSMSSSTAETDLLLVCAVSRTGNNSYSIDVIYAIDLRDGDVEQILPTDD